MQDVNGAVRFVVYGLWAGVSLDSTPDTEYLSIPYHFTFRITLSISRVDPK